MVAKKGNCGIILSLRFRLLFQNLYPAAKLVSLKVPRDERASPGRGAIRVQRSPPNAASVANAGA